LKSHSSPTSTHDSLTLRSGQTGDLESIMTTSLASPLTTDDREAIRRFTEEEWTTALLARDWDRSLALCTQDIVYMAADQPVLRGHRALRDWLNQFPPIVRFTQPLEEVAGQGNLAIARARFDVAIDASGQHIENTGKALCWFEKDTSGRWLAKAVCWNWDRPLTRDVEMAQGGRSGPTGKP
jgi:ketosteroid isomerase-like protein